MAWEWIVLAAITIIGPVIFRGFLPVRQVFTVRGGGVFDFTYTTTTQIIRCGVKFGFIWLIALALSQLESRLWLRLFVVVLPAGCMTAHSYFVMRCGVHWLTGRSLAADTANA